MKHKGLLTVLLLIGVAMAGVYGCGGGGGSDVTIAPPATGLNAESAVCAQCHGGPAGQYALSLHNTENAATCARCHQPAPGHPNPTTAVSNPDAAGTCFECHFGQTGRVGPHFNPTSDFSVPAATEDKKPAQFVDAALTTPNSNIFPVTRVSQLNNPALFPDKTALTQQGCNACHNPHDTTSRMSIFRDYARNSGHGDVNGEGWIHYRWKGANRAACQRCHTTSAFIAYITGGGGGAPRDGRMTFDANDDTKQTLYCNACHVDNTYAMRVTGAVTNNYAGGAVTFPDIGKSNLCMNCHTGRENGDSIKANAGDFSNLGFINSHYLTGGATVYTSSGYEYAGRNYANPPTYQHDQIGMPAFPATGDGGPCVGCHMRPARHTFKPVTLVAGTGSRTITGIVSNACAVCHTPGSGLTPITTDTMNAEKDRFDAALQALQTILATNAQRPLFFGSGNPYFFTAPFVEGGANTAVRNWLSAGDADTTGNTTGKNNMGAAFNLNLFRHDYGAFTHNRFYVKRLIYDSIDWIDDNVLNDSVEATINALPVGATDYTITAAQKAAAVVYLLGAPGGARP